MTPPEVESQEAIAAAEASGWKATGAPSPAAAPVQVVKKPRPDFNAIPAALRGRDQWVLWKMETRSGKPTKVPYFGTVTDDGAQLKPASTTDPLTWSTFEKIRDDFEKYFPFDLISGIGFVFKEGDGVVGIDVDHQRDPLTGLWETGILEKILSFNSYAELSQSGTGAHVMVMGEKPGKKCRSGDLEIYDAGRFFVMTGKHIPETPSNVKEATAGTLETLYREIAPDPIPYTVQPLERSSALPVHLEDTEVIRRAEKALNGPKFTALFRVGNLTEYGGDHSAADLALCNLLAFWSKDRNQIDRIFRGSALYRSKWDEQRGVNTYGENTISEALTSSTRTRTLTPTTEQAGASDNSKPKIRVNGRQLCETTADALKALKAANIPPRLFARAGIPTRIDKDEDGRPVIRSMNEHMIRHELARSAVFQRIETRITRDKDDKEITSQKTTSVSPPVDVVRDLMALPDLSQHLRPLRAIIEAPTIRSDGGLVIEPGYDEVSGLYYAPSPGLVVPEIPTDPTREQVAAAVELVKESICDFPYVDDASRANAIGALMTPILRGMISGLVPLGLLDKPQAGTGASLLAGAIALIATGSQAHMKPAPEHREEWAKEILSTLREGSAIVIYDNVEGRFYAPALASVLTAEMYSGRLLGSSEMVSYPNRVTWFATGINIELSGDLPRRCYWVRMDAKSPRPWTDRPNKFKHPDLMDWIRGTRGDIIAAVLTIGRAWLRDGGMIDKTKVITLGGYETWSHTIGGILAYVGIEGFLSNLEELYSETDADAPQWGAFLERWYSIWGSGSVTVAGLTKFLQESDTIVSLEGSLFEVLPEDVASAYTQRTKFTRVLGAALRHRNLMRYPNGYWLERQMEKYGNALQWRVMYDPDQVVRPQDD